MSRDVDAALAIGYTLNRHVPSMNDKGFTIGTSYGDLVIPPGRLACHIADLVAQDARLELMRLDAASRMGEPS
jgi:hypothetical protein